MQALSLSPFAGWRWVRDGFTLFRAQPIPLFTWALMIGLLVLLASILVPIGPVLFVMIMPIITVVTLQACREIEAGRPMQPWHLVGEVLRSGKARRLLGAGSVYVAAVLLAGLIAFVPFMGHVADVAAGIQEEGDVAALYQAVRTPLLIFGLLYLVVAALFWHAPVLIAWHDMGLRKALFFSGVACWRNKGAFVVYGMVWAAAVFGLEVVGALLRGMGLSAQFAGFLQMPLNFALAAMLYASFYSTYTTVFHDRSPEAPPPGQSLAT